MDLIPPLGVYAAMLREQGRPLDFPGGAARVAQAVDVDLLARAIAWSGEAKAAQNEAFNVTNGDVFTWENIWPAVADALEMKPGKPVPLSLAKEFPNWVSLGTRCDASMTSCRRTSPTSSACRSSTPTTACAMARPSPVRPRSSRRSRSTAQGSPR
ncbi:hypothetical protein ACQ5SK_15135 [Bradyrhizobium japonicum]